VPDLQLVLFLAEQLRLRLAQCRLEPDRGDVAEKIVIVGIFVALAVAVGLIITKAVTGDANNIAQTINGS